MYYFYFFIILSLISIVGQAQNLVPNPSFEDTIVCPFSANEVNAAVSWHPSRESPDYYNVCNTFTVGLPLNFSGYQYAQNGNAYMGFVTYSRNSIDAREHFTCQLISPLTIGTKYFLSFYLSHANNHYPLSCNKIGLLFSTVNYDLTNISPINNQSQFYTDSIIEDTLNWVLVTGSFVADSNYSHLSVGGFFTDLLTDTIYHPPATHSYYFIDNICVSTDSLTCNSFVSINEIIPPEEWSVFPNPFSNNLNINIQSKDVADVSLFDTKSKLIFRKAFVNSLSINTTQLPSGFYFYEVKNKNGLFKMGMVVKK